MDIELLNKIKSIKIANHLPSLHDSTITGLAKLPNSNHVITASTDKTIIIRNYINNQIIKRLYGHTDFIFSLCILSDNRIVTGSKDRTIRIWNIQNDDYPCEKVLYGHKGAILKIKELQKGIILSCGTEDKCMRIWKINGKNPLIKKMRLKDICSEVVFYSNELFLLTEGPLIKLFNWKHKIAIKTYKGHTNFVQSICILQNNNFLSSSWDNTCRLWITRTGECLRQFCGNAFAIGILQISKEIFATGYFNGEVKFWHINQEECINTIQIDEEPTGIFLKLDQQTIMYAGQSEELTILQFQYIFEDLYEKQQCI